VNIQNNNKIGFFTSARIRLQRWGGWALLAGVPVTGGLAMAICDSSTARSALSLLYRLLWA